MKHNDNKLPEALKKLSALRKPQRFYTIGEGRYTVLFKRTVRRGPTRTASSTALVPESFVGALYIYDSESHERSPIYTIDEVGILGLHGTKPAVVEQLTLIDDLVIKTLRMATTMDGMK